ncbi:MAG: hypothetical protein I3274_05610 [Candidatus Moeniiplasma glomeromycotorum]|nr:hypothetical protein [Candidatus Moeniiplasma glomeromycotorum]
MASTKLTPFKYSPLKLFNVKGKEEEKRTKTWTLRIEIDNFPIGYCGQCLADYEKINEFKKQAAIGVDYSFELKDNSVFQQPLYLSFENLDYNFKDKNVLPNKIKTYYCYECSAKHITNILGVQNPSIDWDELDKEHFGDFFGMGIKCPLKGHPKVCYTNRSWLGLEILQELNKVCGVENNEMKKPKEKLPRF